MDVDDEFLVLIVGDVEYKGIREENLGEISNLVVEDLIKTAEKHGELVDFDIKSIVKQEPLESIVIKDEYYEEEVLNDEDYCPDLMGSSEDDNLLVEVKRKSGKRRSGNRKRADDGPMQCKSIVKKKEKGYYNEDILNPDDYSPDPLGYSNGKHDLQVSTNQWKRVRNQKPEVMSSVKFQVFKSFVRELMQRSPELGDSQDLLIKTLADYMKEMKPPDLPKELLNYDAMFNMFECTICGHSMNTEKAAVRHYREKHGERYLVCLACGDDFRYSQNLYKHEKRCKAPDAEIVLKARALTEGSMARTYIRKDGLKKKEKTIPRVIKPKIKSTLKPRKKIIQESTQRAILRCELCPATFRTRLAMQAHEFMHQGVRPYQCEQCPSAFTSKASFTYHSLVKHRGGVEYICDICQTTLHSRSGIITHLESHQVQKKYLCPQCGKGYAQKRGIKVHIDRVHRNLPLPFACQICPRRFQRMSTLTEHMIEEHDLQVMTRAKFYRTLPNMSSSQLVEHAKVFFTSQEDEIEPQKNVKECELSRTTENISDKSKRDGTNNEQEIVFTENSKIIELNERDASLENQDAKRYKEDNEVTRSESKKEFIKGYTNNNSASENKIAGEHKVIVERR